MDAKRAATIGIAAAAAGAGAYFLFSKKYAPQRQRLAEKMRTGTKIAVENVSRIAGQTRRNMKTALKDVSQVSEKAAANL